MLDTPSFIMAKQNQNVDLTIQQLGLAGDTSAAGGYFPLLGGSVMDGADALGPKNVGGSGSAIDYLTATRLAYQQEYNAIAAARAMGNYPVPRSMLLPVASSEMLGATGATMRSALDAEALLADRSSATGASLRSTLDTEALLANRSSTMLPQELTSAPSMGPQVNTDARSMLQLQRLLLQQQQELQQQQLQQEAAAAKLATGDQQTSAASLLQQPWSVTSASRLGTMLLSQNPTAGPESAAKKVPKKKSKDKPKRPLSAYNIFFKEERQRILNKIETPPKLQKEKGEQQIDSDSLDKQPSRKKKKIKHGKIGFESLAKQIGQKWQDLTEKQVAVYKAKADEDMKRYREEMAAYNAKQSEVVLSKKRKAERDPI